MLNNEDEKTVEMSVDEDDNNWKEPLTSSTIPCQDLQKELDRKEKEIGKGPSL